MGEFGYGLGSGRGTVGVPPGGGPGGGGPGGIGALSFALSRSADRSTFAGRGLARSAEQLCCDPGNGRQHKGSLDVTPRILAERQWESRQIREMFWDGQEINDEGWNCLSVDRPTLWYSLSVLDGVLLYAPGSKPVTEAEAYRAPRPGIVYMAHPGIWWFKYSLNPGALSLRARMLAVDCSDPGTLALHLARVGSHNDVEAPAGGIDVAIPAAANVQVLGPLYERQSLMIQNTGANSIRVRLDGVAAAANSGFLLAAGSEPWTFGADLVPRKGINVFSAAGSSVWFHWYY